MFYTYTYHNMAFSFLKFALLLSIHILIIILRLNPFSIYTFNMYFNSLIYFIYFSCCCFCRIKTIRVRTNIIKKHTQICRFDIAMLYYLYHRFWPITLAHSSNNRIRLSIKILLIWHYIVHRLCIFSLKHNNSIKSVHLCAFTVQSVTRRKKHHH